MKIIINSAYLTRALQFANKVISTNPVIPILEDFLCLVNGGVLRVIGSDLQTYLIVKLQVASLIKDKAQEFSFLLPRKAFTYIAALEEQPITLEYFPDLNKVIIKEDNAAAEFSVGDPKDYVKIPECKNFGFTFEDGSLPKITKALAYASRDELRPALNGVFFGYRGRNFELVATDGHRLVAIDVPELKRVKEKGDEQLFILPRKAAKILGEMEGKYVADPVSVWTDKVSTVCFKYCNVLNVELISRIIAERYVDYGNESVIPTSHNSVLTLDKKQFLRQLAKAMNFVNRTTYRLSITLSEEKCELKADDLDFSNSYTAELDKISFEGAGMEIGFNCKYLQEAVKSMDDEFMIKLVAPNKGILLQSKEHLAMLMPVMIHQYV